MFKTLRGNNQIPKVDGATHTSADASHHHHARFPDAERLGRGDGCGGQPLLKLSQGDDPDTSRSTRHIRNHVGRALADTALKLKARNSLDPLQFFVQPGQKENVGSVIGLVLCRWGNERIQGQSPKVPSQTKGQARGSSRGA